MEKFNNLAHADIEKLLSTYDLKTLRETARVLNCIYRGNQTKSSLAAIILAAIAESNSRAKTIDQNRPAVEYFIVPNCAPTYDYIVHLADIHIRDERQEEYREVFNNLYNNLLEHKDKRGLIVIAGDLVDVFRTTPRIQLLVKDFIEMLASLFDVFIVPGNHDVNTRNPDENDAIEAILYKTNMMKNSEQCHAVWYYNKRGIYQLGNLNIAVNDFFNPIIEFEEFGTISEGKTNICIYHGIVSGCIVNNVTSAQINKQITSHGANIKVFAGYDITLLGDIHKQQFLDNERRIAYCGSLVQQNISESTSKGYILWNIQSRDATFIPIKNNHAFVRINLDASGTVCSALGDARNLSIKFKYICGWRAGITERAVDWIKQQGYTVVRVYNHKCDDIPEDIRADVSAGRFNADEEIYKHIDLNMVDTHRKYASLCTKVSGEYGVAWTPDTLTFHNILSYSERSTLQFTDFKGVIGIEGANAAGKSNIDKIIQFAMFGTVCPKISLVNLVNKNAKTGGTTLTIFVGDTKYKIVREVSLTNSSKVSLFKIIDGVEINENLNHKKNTEVLVADLLGQVNQFDKTSRVTNTTVTEFCKMLNEKGFVTLLNEIFDLKYFEDLSKLAKKDIKIISDKLKLLIHDERRLSAELLEYTGIEAEIAKYRRLIEELHDYMVVDADHKKYEARLAEVQQLIKDSVILADIVDNEKFCEYASKYDSLNIAAADDDSSMTDAAINQDMHAIYEIAPDDILRGEELCEKVSTQNIYEITKYFNESKLQTSVLYKERAEIAANILDIQQKLSELNWIENIDLAADHTVDVLTYIQTKARGRKNSAHTEYDIEKLSDYKISCGEAAESLRHAMLFVVGENIKNIYKNKVSSADDFCKKLVRSADLDEIINKHIADILQLQIIIENCNVDIEIKSLDAKINNRKILDYTAARDKLNARAIKNHDEIAAAESMQKQWRESIHNYNVVTNYKLWKRAAAARRVFAAREAIAALSLYRQQLARQEQNARTRSALKNYTEESNQLLCGVAECIEKKRKIEVDYAAEHMLEIILEKKSRMELKQKEVKIIQEGISNEQKILESLNGYRTILEQIPAECQRRYRSFIVARVNKILDQMQAGFEIMPGEDCVAAIVNKTTLPFLCLSGFQRLIMVIAFKLAFNDCGSLVKSQILIIDEALEVMDDHHLKIFETILERIKHSYKYTFIISHDSRIQNLAEHRIIITKNINGSGIKLHARE